eukprot:CAMPEP_0181172660 /NCGR_PEP_ID=MMETSP1096-20121128/2567_1 /TAXON_ID=156174 ORGANISM="Chrysochromulina ericina, Strain CCMP281" /NCGR_SAMPLE_ID=MMETSP1096 /ASSEMBLY_ACC=CAM_ASM_000453 /LENGTH=117 /DNA_ID=CAMNT_0023260401 /DNA_START=540 /DNA_END=889 /DNA_ORIENTATION=-
MTTAGRVVRTLAVVAVVSAAVPCACPPPFPVPFPAPFPALGRRRAGFCEVAAAVVAVTLARGRSAGGEVWETAVVRVGGMAEVVAEVAEVGVAEEADEDLVGADEGPVVAVGDTTTL